MKPYLSRFCIHFKQYALDLSDNLFVVLRQLLPRTVIYDADVRVAYQCISGSLSYQYPYFLHLYKCIIVAISPFTGTCIVVATLLLAIKHWPYLDFQNSYTLLELYRRNRCTRKV